MRHEADRHPGRGVVGPAAIVLGAALAVVSPTAAGAASTPAWSASEPYDGYGVLHDVTAVHAGDAWAVGTGRDAAGVPTAVAVHWDGTRWQRVDTGAPALASFNGVDATAPDDVWAVGGAEVTSARTTRVVTFVQHYDGTAWTVVPSPNAGWFGGNGSLYDVSAASRTDAWAVGSYLQGRGGETAAAFALRWNGRRWTEVRTAPVDAPTSELFAVATAGGEAWAVGRTGGDDPQPLVQRWDGRRWNAVALPSLPGAVLRDVVASDGTVRVVGSWEGRPLVLERTGESWTDRSPETSALVTWLTAADVDADGHLHVVGQAIDADGTWTTLSLFWDGSTWTAVTPPQVGDRENVLNGVSFAGRTGFAAGDHLTSDEAVPERPLVLSTVAVAGP